MLSSTDTSDKVHFLHKRVAELLKQRKTDSEFIEEPGKDGIDSQYQAVASSTFISL